MEDKEENNWHLDKRVNLSIIISLVSISLGAALWLGSLESRVVNLEEVVPELKAAGLRIEDKMDNINEQLFELIGIMKERSK